MEAKYLIGLTIFLFLAIALISYSSFTPTTGMTLILGDQNIQQDFNGATDFNGLTDTPANYTGSGGKCVAVKGTEDGLEFIVCGVGGGTVDTTLDINVDALASFLSKSYDWNADQNFLVSNIFDLNLGQDHFAVNGLDFNVFDLNYSVRSVCSGDSNSVLNSVGNCVDITGFHLSGGTSNFSDLILDNNSSFDARYILLVDSNNVSRLDYFVIKDFNQAVLASNDWNGLGIDSNCSVSGSCILVAYVSDVNAELEKKAYTTDVNAQLELKAFITDVNGVDNLRLFGYDLNAVVLDLNKLVYVDVNSWIDSKIAGLSFIDTNWANEFLLFDANMSATYLKISDSNSGLGRFAGYTESVYDGNVYFDDGSRYYGYVAVNKICASIYLNAHACTTDEILLTIADGNITGFTQDAWVQEGPPGYLSNSNDCVGWTNKSASGYYGAFFLMNAVKGGYGSLGGCNNEKYFACCN